MQQLNTLQRLLTWANRAYVEETPELQYSRSETEDDGDPDMRGPVKAHLGLNFRERLSKDAAKRQDTEADDWRRLACRTDHESGKYLTPLRCAIERVPGKEMRTFLRDLVPELYRPSDIAAIHGIPDWAAPIVMHRALTVLRQNFREAPETQWISGRSDAQRAAETPAEAA